MDIYVYFDDCGEKHVLFCCLICFSFFPPIGKSVLFLVNCSGHLAGEKAPLLYGTLNL